MYSFLRGLAATAPLAILAMAGGCSDLGAVGAGGAGGNIVVGGFGPAGSSGAGLEGSGGGLPPTEPLFELPAYIDVPFVVAGAGASVVDVSVKNRGGVDAEDVVWSITGDPSLTIVAAPKRIAAMGSATLRVRFAGAASEAIARAKISVKDSFFEHQVPVFGVAGDPGIGASTWEKLEGPGGVTMGEGATIAMPFAPYPDGSGTFEDPSVHVFLPEGYRERGSQDLVLHFHGFDGTIATTLPTHLYREQVYASGANAALIVPQGPVDAPSGDFGKLMKPGGVANLLREVLVVLYRDGKIQAPVLDELRLTSHSGGYEALATNLMSAAMAPRVTSVGLFDSMYDFVPTFEDFVTAGGKLRSSYTCCGGTEDDNATFRADLMAKGVDVVTTQTEKGLRDAGAVDFFADSSHDDSTRVDGGYGEELRWGMTHSRKGPRVELRTVTSAKGRAHVTWLAPHDDDTLGYEAQASTTGESWTTVATTDGQETSSASFPLAKGTRVRVVPVVGGIAEPLTSDVYRVDPDPKILVVDAFDRIVDGGYGGLSHDFAAIVGEAAGPVATVAHRALTEGGFDLAPFEVVIWSLGDESTLDHAMSDAEQALVTSYLAHGGHLVVAGSNLGYALEKSSAGTAFLAETFGAAFAADDSGSTAVAGAGPLASLIPFAIGGTHVPYAVPDPDAFTATGKGKTLLRYATGKAAAVGVAGKAVLVGFPFEDVPRASDRKALVTALVGFVRGA